MQPPSIKTWVKKQQYIDLIRKCDKKVCSFFTLTKNSSLTTKSDENIRENKLTKFVHTGANFRKLDQLFLAFVMTSNYRKRRTTCRNSKLRWKKAELLIWHLRATPVYKNGWYININIYFHVLEGTLYILTYICTNMYVRVHGLYRFLFLEALTRWESKKTR